MGAIAVIGGLLTAVGAVGTSSAVAAPVLTGCNAQPDPVVCENNLAGDPTSDWNVEEPGDLSIQGFGTDQSVSIGQTINFKISTTAASYHVDILRLGWYGGDGARKLTSIPNLVGHAQAACLVDNTNTTGLVDCGNWSVSTSWTVPTDAVSGVYIAHLVRADTGGDSLIEFVVRNDASHSDIVYQTSDVTREAYNQYGGNSLYECSVACPPGNPLVYKAAYKVSFNRPNTAATLGGMYSFFDAEYPMVQFLEENGYDVSYISGVDTDRSGALLQNHKLFMDSGHDEYWSGAQRANVTAARDKGVNLAFFSGNEVFWKTRYENSIDGTNTADRTLVTYKETHFNAPTDPQDPTTWTGTWRDTRFSPPADAQPENSLTGQIYMVDPPSPFAIQVPGTYAGLRFWRQTSVAQLALSGTATLAPNSLGYEWDVDLDNGFRPAGETELSSTTQSVQNTVLDYYGNNEGPGTATHHLTLYRAASGALVFGSGTVQWAYGLEPNGNSTVNQAMQQATVNLLADMGIQPEPGGSLISGLVRATASADHTAPTSTITSPAVGATLNNGSTVTVTGTAQDTGGGVVAGMEVSTDSGTTWHPAPIAAATASTTWSYTWNVTGNGPTTIKTRATDDSQNTENPSAGRSVTVACPCQIFPSSSVPKLADSGDPNAAELGVKFTSSTDGYVTGVRFYKSAANTGTHIGDLWSSTGQLLATATFTSESASGWQQVTFAQAVHVTPNTVYVASYHTNGGHEATDTQAFSGRTVSSPPLTALQSSTDTSATVNVSGPNGVFAYSTTPTFPTTGFADANYYVDVTFRPTAAAPFVVGQTPAPGATNQSTIAPVAATFSEDVVPSSITFTLTGAGNAAVPATVSYNSTSHTATLTPNAPLATGTTFTATVSTATDSQGHNLVAPVSWSFTTFACPCSLWGSSVTPQKTDSGDGGSVELGVQFSSNVNGYMYGLRFYKAVTNTGTHVGSLWSSTGTLLARVTFQNETASGWQQASFMSPVPVTAGTTYVVSYHTTAGHYSADSGYFSAGAVTSGPLQAPGSNLNDLYAYGPNPTFPTSTFNGTNYWVDPVFDVQAPANGAPTITAVTPAAGATNVALTTTVTATFSEAVQASSVVFTLTGGGTSVPATLSYDVATVTSTLTPSSPLIAGTTYTATVSQATDLLGKPMAAPFSWTFTAVGVTCPCTLWPSSATPAVASANDSSAIEVGTRFTADRTGYVTGIRFYKGAGNTGTHIGDLWSSTGQLLATGVFSNETASGWQELDFSNSVAVTAGTVYVVSYHTNTGNYAYTSNYFATNYDNSPLHAPSGANGVYAIGPTGFPNQSFNSTNYWVDAVFNTVAQPPVRTTPPVVSATTPASGATGVATTSNLTATFDEAVSPSSITFGLTDSSNNPVPGAQTYNQSTRTATFTPTSAFATAATYHASIRATDLAGNAMSAPTTWSFTTVPPNCPCTIWSASTIPGAVDSGDPTAIELGVRFQAALGGYVTGVRFYKSAANTGTHVGNLWSNTGQLLATATFTSETASGWQTVAFSPPVAVTAGTTYVASYHTNVGHYSYDNGYFASAPTNNPPLKALQDGISGSNGTYAISATSVFPTQTFQSNNYWVDVVFALASPGTTPTVTATSPVAGSTGVATASAVVATFNESVVPSTISFVVHDPSNNAVAGALAYNPATLTATFTPSSPLRTSTVYSVNVSGATDLANDAMTSAATWSFTTGVT